MDIQFETWFNVHNILSGESLGDKREVFEDCWNSARKDLLDVVDEKTEIEDELEDAKYDVEDLTEKLRDVMKSLKKIDEHMDKDEILEELNYLVEDIADSVGFFENK